MKRLALFLFAMAVAVRLGATAQQPDLLKIGTQTYAISTNPLAPVLASKRLPKPEMVTSSLWRGYIATWAVRENRLFLDDVQVPTASYMEHGVPESKQWRSAMGHLFRDPAPRLATWFTGHLVVPTGEVVEYVHMGYGSTYASYLVFTVVKGEIRKQQDMKRDEFDAFRRAQYEAFKKTPEYAKARAEVKKMDATYSDELTEELLFQFTAEEYLSRIF